MKFSNALGVEYRVVKDAERDGKDVRIVSGSRLYQTDKEDLWDAVANPERIPNWLLPISGDLKLGGRYQLEGHAGGEINQCDPPELFDVTWECGGNVSWVTVRFEAEGSKTRLTLEHAMGKDAASEEHWTKYGPGATGVGWELAFMGLGIYLEQGQAVSQEESQAWMTTEAGKSFMRDSAKHWGEAHIESGSDPEIAKAMAEETAKAYAGQ